MIIKFVVENDIDKPYWAYHECNEIIIQEDIDVKDHSPSCLIYTVAKRGKIAHMRTGGTNSPLKSVIYNTAYLIDNDGGTINNV